MDGDGLEAGAAQEGEQAGGREMRAVAGEVEVVPALAAQTRLQAGQVGHADEQRASRAQPAHNARGGRARRLDVFEHVPQRHRVERSGGNVGVRDVGARERHAVLAHRGLDAAGRRLEPARVVAGPPRGGDEAPAARAHVHEAAGRRGDRREHPEACAVECVQDRRRALYEPRRSGGVRAAVVQIGGGWPRGHRRAAPAAAQQEERAGECRLGRGRPPPRREHAGAGGADRLPRTQTAAASATGSSS